MADRAVQVIPDPGRTIEGLRDTGYSFETAVADLVDNSIAAGATVVDITVQLDLRGQVRLSLADNGCGMDHDGLVQAMTYGSPRRPDPASLGKFGLGLKTASTAFCRRLSVITRPAGGVAKMATWDLDYVATQGRWLLQVSDEPDEDAAAHLEQTASDRAGTVVLWTRVDRLLRADYRDPSGKAAQNALKKRCEGLKQHLGMTFQRFLDSQDDRGRNIRIRLNGTLVSAWDPFQKGYSELVAQETMEVPTGAAENARFTVRAYILPRREEFPDDAQAEAARISPDLQGIFIYREQRLIHAGTWLDMFRKEPHSNLLRIEFSFDHRLDAALHLDIRKSQIILNEALVKWLRDEFLTAPRREANHRYRKGSAGAATRKGKEHGHRESNRTISSKESQVGGPKVSLTDAATGEVEVTNRLGTVTLKLPVGSAEVPGQVHVQPSDDVVDGVLFEPALIEGHKAVRINTGHPYYHKVYIPNLSDTVTVQGLDSLLWALCVAELSTTSAETEDLFGDLRFEVSRILRKLVEGLPDPPESDLE
ncbi:MAG: ATP-binding protein [Dehalococcoidia bacterium]|nr:ATP-binding protein [Dehalococcoidia bacterium]